MTFGKRITQLREEKGYTTRKKFAEKLSLPETTLRNYETDAREPGHTFLKQMSDFFNVSTDYLLGLTEEREKYSSHQLKSSEMEHIEKYRSLDASGKKHIDYELDRECARMAELNDKDNRISTLEKELIPKRILAYHGKIAAAGQSCGFNDIAAGTIECPLTEISQNADYAIGVNGDSMEPTYRDGDIVYVKKATHLDIGDIGIFQKDNGIYIKEVGENGLISHNQKYKPMVNGGAVICLGKVLGKLEIF